MTGLFVTFEGGEGSGKSTQTRPPRRAAARPRHRAAASRASPAARRSRRASATCCSIPRAVRARCPRRCSWRPRAPTWSRASCARRWRPGRVVLCDRYDDSTLAYQGAGRGLDPGLLAILNRRPRAGSSPTSRCSTTCRPRWASRAARAPPARPTGWTASPPISTLRVRRCFLDLAAAEPERWVVLDATATPDELERLGWAALEQRLAAAGR